jgi:hypothetical protein
VVLAAHEGQLDDVLDLLDVQRGLGTGVPQQRGLDLLGQFGDDVVDTRGRRGVVTLDREERLGQRHRDLAGVEGRDVAVPPDDSHGDVRRVLCGRRTLVGFH